MTREELLTEAEKALAAAALSTDKSGWVELAKAYMDLASIGGRKPPVRVETK